MPLFQLIYVSQPFGFDDLDLLAILTSARRHNVPAGITGALICREDLYMQLLEGDAVKVQSTYERIVRDKRHVDVTLKFSGPADGRLFPDWAMRHDPAQSWMWTREEVAAGALDAASAEDVRAVFTRLASMPAAADQKCPMHG